MKRAAAFVAMATLTVLVPHAAADTFSVTRTNDPVPDGCKRRDCSLREAVIKANTTAASDTIVLKARTYVLTREGEDATSDSGDLDVLEPLRIRGIGLGRSVIDGAWPSTPDRLLELQDESSLVAKGVTLRDGGDFDTAASALFVPPTGRAVLRRSRVHSNDSDFTAVDNFGGRFTATRVVFSRNRASCCPAFYNENGGVATLKQVVFLRNRAQDDTGAIYSDGQRLTIRDSLFERNVAGDVGGAIIASLGTLNISNTTFSGNRSDAHGGGLYMEVGDVLLNNVTFTKNVADADDNTDGDGGGIYDSGGLTTDLTVVNTIVAGNRDPGGEAPDCAGSSGDVFVSLGFNLIGSDTGCSFTPAGSDLSGAAKLGRLRDNGGFTKTHALKRSSKAVNKGSKAKPGSAAETACERRDQRGVKRPQGKRCDIGAYERD